MNFDLNTVIKLLGLAVTWGTLLAKISALEKKQDKHNNLIERMYKVEESTKSAHKRIDELHEEVMQITK